MVVVRGSKGVSDAVERERESSGGERTEEEGRKKE